MAKKYQKISKKTNNPQSGPDNTRVAPQAKTTAKTVKKTEGSFNNFLFTKKNYILMAITLAIITLGFIVMYGKENIYDFRKTVVAPIIVLFGFAFGVYAILYKDKAEQ